MNAPPRQRADLLLVERGYFPTRAQAQAAIAAGTVTADGQPVRRASDRLSVDAVLEATAPHPWVSRAGLKLVAALDASGIDPEGQFCLDLGASTGGFTDVLLARGARHVVAVDVGRDQLHPRLRTDGRVTVMEAKDARSLVATDLPSSPTLVVADLSFIGLAKALPVPLALAAPQAWLVTLIKPQFEAGPARVGKGGLVAPDVAEAVATEVAASLDGMAGFRQAGLIESPVLGGDGNREYLWWGRRG